MCERSPISVRNFVDSYKSNDSCFQIFLFSPFIYVILMILIFLVWLVNPILLLAIGAENVEKDCCSSHESIEEFHAPKSWL